jgi:nucleoside-diphosphate-sugar epimerase
MFESYVPRHLTDPLWQRLANARLFITGGTGLFGHWLLDSLTDANIRLNLKIEATVLTRNPDMARAKMPNLNHRIRFLKGAVEEFSLVTEKFDFILHMATTSAEETYYGTNQTQKLEMLFEGTQRIIELAHNSSAKRVLFTSSGAVYGKQDCVLIRETVLMQVDPIKAASGLALGKSVAEFLLTQAISRINLEVVIARCFSFVGPGMPMDLHYAIGNFIKNAAEKNPIVIKGDGSAVRSYMFMGDLIYWLLKLLLDGKSGEPYNVGSDQPISILNLAKKISLLNGKKLEVIVEGASDYSVGVPSRNIYVPSIEKSKSELQLELNTDLDSAISFSLDHFLRINSFAKNRSNTR